MEQTNNDTVEFVFYRNLYPDITITAKKNEILSDVIERYQNTTNINGNGYYYSYNNQKLDLNSYVNNLNINNNKAYIQVIKNTSDSILMSNNSVLRYSILNESSIDFDESGNTTKLLADNMRSFRCAADEYEAMTNSKGQNEYFLRGGQRIDPNKSPEENGIIHGSKIIVKKKDDTMSILRNSIGLTLCFKKKYYQNIEIQVTYNDLVKIAIDKFLNKFQMHFLNNQQIQNTKFIYLFNEKRLNEFETILQSGLRDRSEIIVEENNNKIINVVFSRDYQRITVQAYADETVGEVINKYRQKSNLTEYSGYMFVFNVKILGDFSMTLREVGIVKDGAEINVVPPGVIGAK